MGSAVVCKMPVFLPAIPDGETRRRELDENACSDVIKLDGAQATGVSYCLAHHVKNESGKRSLMIAAIRYLNTFTKQDGAWYFAERNLMVDWIETRSLSES